MQLSRAAQPARAAPAAAPRPPARAAGRAAGRLAVRASVVEVADAVGAAAVPLYELAGAQGIRAALTPAADYFSTLGVPDWLVHWGHPGNMAVVLLAMGGYGSYLGWQIRLSDDGDLVAKAKDLHPKLTAGMFFFFALGATGGMMSLIMQGKPIFESSHVWTGLAGLSLLSLQAMLPLFFSEGAGARTASSPHRGPAAGAAGGAGGAGSRPCVRSEAFVRPRPARAALGAAGGRTLARGCRGPPERAHMARTMAASGRALLAALLLAAAGAAVASPGPAAFGDAWTSEAALRQRRSLLGATQQISQCEWLSGEGCALHPAYVTYTLNHTGTDVVASYVANSLSCASVLDKSACEGAGYCHWDPAYASGQQGCFLHDAALLGLQASCVKPAAAAPLAALQQCMAAQRSCQCSTASGEAAGGAGACLVRQAQLLAGFSGKPKVCQSLLGCWLSALNGSSPDVTQLVEVQLAVVQPALAALASPAAGDGAAAAAAASPAGRRRRGLLQALPALSAPVTDDPAPTPAPVGPDDMGGLMLESGSYPAAGVGGGGGAAPSRAGAAAGGPSVGMNGVILSDDRGAAPSPVGSPVEYGRNVPGLQSTGGAGGSMNDAYQLESGSGGDGAAWGGDAAPVDPDAVFGGGSGAGSGAGAGGAGAGAAPADAAPAGGDAPASFWRCAGAAAAKADTTRKWADVDYNSKSLSLGTWARVIAPTALVDWGVQTLECFKAEVAALPGGAGPDAARPNKESAEYAIVGLIRSFSAAGDALRGFLQAAPAARPGTAAAGLRRLSGEVLPGQLAALRAKYSPGGPYGRDVLLQAAALLADMQWFLADAGGLLGGAGGPDGVAQVVEGVAGYVEDMMRRSLYWLFALQFGGPPAYLPAAPPSTPASEAAMAAYDGLAAAAFPAPALAADAPAWQQLRGMLDASAGAAAAAAAAAPRGGALSPAALLGNTAAARWAPLRGPQVALLGELQRVVAAAGAGGSDAAALAALPRSLRELVAASRSFLVTGTEAPDAERTLVDALSYSEWLAGLLRQCKGSPAGLPPLGAGAAAAAGLPATRVAACAALGDETQRIAAATLSGAGDVLVSTLGAQLTRQWACNSVAPGGCATAPGCQLALAGTVTPGSAGAAGAAAPAAAASAELLLGGGASGGPTLACQATDAALVLTSWTNASKSALAAGGSCEDFLLLPDCEALPAAATCNNYGACRWEPGAQRDLLHTAGGNASAAGGGAAPPPGAKGGCAVDWVAVLKSGGGAAYAPLGSMASLCGGIADAATCGAQSMIISLDATVGAAAPSMARVWVPALVVATVLGLVAFGAAVLWRRRSALARRAAEEAAAAGGGGAGSGRGGRRGARGGAARGDGGKGAKGAKGGAAGGAKKKVKRAEPGSYKPDLMRDSFTDYMRAAPQQFTAGVALARAAQAAGGLDAALAAGDVAGGHALGGGGGGGAHGQPPAAAAAHAPPAGGLGLGMGAPLAAPRGPGGLGVPRVSGSLPPLPPGAHAGGGAGGGPSDLIDLQGGGAAQQQQQHHLHQPHAPAGLPYGAGGGLWGAAGGGGGGRLSGGGLSAGLSGGLLSGGLSGEVDLLDTGASLALTSSLGLVSSLPQHASLQPDMAALLGAAAGAAAPLQAPHAGGGELRLGLPRGGGGRLGAPGAAADGGGSGALLLGSRASGDIEDGASTPTSSCCHDSVCTFRHGAGSSVGSGPARPGPGSAAGSWRGGPRPPSAARGGASASGLAGALSGAHSGALSRSSWSSALSTDMLMSSQHSATAPAAKAPSRGGAAEPAPPAAARPRVVVLGSGWGSMSFVKALPREIRDAYEVVVVSPRNHFVYTPLLVRPLAAPRRAVRRRAAPRRAARARARAPVAAARARPRACVRAQPAVAAGTLEEQSIVEPVRSILHGKGTYYEASCTDVDPRTKTLTLAFAGGGAADAKAPASFKLHYDLLVVGVGASINTFGVRGVEEHCVTFKTLADAHGLRLRVTDCFERAALPITTNAERAQLLSFVVVGGGPTGVEVAAELHDMIHEDLAALYPGLLPFVSVRVVELTDAILSSYDRKVGSYAAKEFERRGIELLLNHRVVGVEAGRLLVAAPDGATRGLPFGAAVWATGIARHPLVKALQSRLPGQSHSRCLYTDDHMRVCGADGSIWAFGDAATLHRVAPAELADELWRRADAKDGRVPLQELQRLLREASRADFALKPHADYLEAQGNGFLAIVARALRRANRRAAAGNGNGNASVASVSSVDGAATSSSDGGDAAAPLGSPDGRLSRAEFAAVLQHVDAGLRTLPATAQVAAQQGAYLADLLAASCFDAAAGRVELPRSKAASPFKYFHKGALCYIGRDRAAMDAPVLGAVVGPEAGLLWRGYETIAQISGRNRTAVALNWVKTKLFGRAISNV
ncbi:NDB1 [Scenedesmus sp. PABB004]|nr:NDB1 [Scenedesmus sp. PABB004]